MRLIIFGLTILGIMTIGLYGEMLGAEFPDPNTGILDGKVFIGHVGPRDGGADGEDEIVFQGGRFLSTSCIKYGFQSAAYTSSRSGDRIVFKAVTHSPKHGQISWQGQIVGDRMKATYLWTKERWYWFDAHEENWFKGTLKTE